MEDIFARTLEVVSDTTEISPELILSKDRHEEVVDARCLLIYLLNNEHQTATIMSNVAQQIAPVVAGLNALQSDVDGIKCKLPNTISVPYPTVTAVNTELYKAAAYGAAAGNYAGAYCNNGYWG